MTEPRNPLAAELGQRMRQLRLDAGLTGAELGERAGLTQPTISKIENGRNIPSLDTFVRMIDALRLPSRVRRDTLALLTRATAYARDHRGEGRGAATHAAIVERESLARELRCFQQAMVPSLLQTAEYARHVAEVTPWLTGHDGTVVADAHTERQSVLYSATRSFEFVITESALRMGPRADSLMRAQIDRLHTLSTLPNVRIGVVPWDAEPRLPPWCGFSLYDRTAVSVIAFTGETISCDPKDVDVHLDAFHAFAAVARHGPAAHPILTRITTALP